MIMTLVLFRFSPPISLEDATRKFESSAPKYVGVPGLLRKHYARTEDGSRVGAVYLWESRAQAEALYKGEWRERVIKLYGVEPEITWFDGPVTVDNTAGGAITKAA